MLIGYVSDENYLALADVLVEIENACFSVESRSRVTGAIYADIEPGEYQITLGKSGYGAKRAAVNVQPGRVGNFRLLSKKMCGFMWPKWVRGGEAASYCINAANSFKLDLWRYGWKKECACSLGWCDEHGPEAMLQIVPDKDFTQTGVQWNRQGYSLEFQKHHITAPQRSGLYYLHAQTADGESCSFPWIVAPAAPQEHIAVLASSISWNAYNNFGGRSNYFSQDGLPPRPVVNSRQDISRYTSSEVWPYEERSAPLSFQRPEPASEIPLAAKITDPISGRMESCFAPGLWRLVGWLERAGFKHDLYSDVQLHFDTFSLDDYKVVVLDNHPEYWSAEMYHKLKTWVFERGGRLLYLGGCGMYAEIEFVDAAAMFCRREGEFALRGEPADHLLGLQYSHGGFQSGAPYRVLHDEHWVFAETGLKNGDLFGACSLHERCPGGASAHELDKIGAHAPAGVVHLAKGDNPENAGADLTIFNTPSGGAVFSTGSLAWTLTAPIDEQISKVTANVLHKFLA